MNQSDVLFLHYLLALRLPFSLNRKECCASICFPLSAPLVVPCVDLLPLVFTVAINEDWQIFPSAGQPVRLLLTVHKFFRDVPTCARKIFVERLTSFVEPWARVTQRLYQIAQIIGLATGGRLGVRVTDRFHLFKNLTEAVELSLASLREEIRKNAENTSLQEISAEAQEAHNDQKKAFSIKNWKSARAPYIERARLTRRAQCYDRYQQVVALHKQGFEQAEIAHRVGVDHANHSKVARKRERFLKPSKGTSDEACLTPTLPMYSRCGRRMQKRLVTLPRDQRERIYRNGKADVSFSHSSSSAIAACSN